MECVRIRDHSESGPYLRAPDAPCHHVRLDESSALSIANDIDTWIGKMERAGELGEYTIGPEDTAWYKASITTEEQAVTAYQRVDDLLRRFLPATREQVARTVQTCGFPGSSHHPRVGASGYGFEESATSA